jgi:hypothetical protein
MAAGLGFKTFTTGEVLTADNVNGYLMQGVLVFASAAARDAAITSPQEGQCCYLKDTDAVQTYSGSAWVGFDDSNAIQNAIVDAKGDIVAASGNDTPARLAVGANETRLVADSVQTTGLKYVADTTNYAIAAKGDLLAGTAADTVAALTVGANNLILSADSATATGLAWQGASTSYTTAWTASTTNPTIGNGTLTARYVRAGNLCLVTIALAFGSTTSGGSGSYYFSLPFTAKTSGNFGLGGGFYMEDAGVAGYLYYPFGASTTTIALRSSTNNQVANNNPFTWANGDYLQGTFIYEVA